jgi:outer membrane lipoprotein-sorting protein
MGCKLLLIVAAVAIAVRPAAAQQTADQIIERHIAALGGRAAFAKVRSRQATGTVSLSTPAGDVPGTIEFLSEAPNKVRTLLKVDLSAAGVGQLVFDQRFDGVNGYVLDSIQGNHDITGEQLDTMRSGSFPDPMLNYKQLGATVQLLGTEKVGDRDTYVLRFEPTSGWPVRSYIDSETLMVLQTKVTLRLPELTGDIEQTTTFSDYRAVDGIKVPFRMRVSSPLQSISITFTDLKHNVPADPALFKKP